MNLTVVPANSNQTVGSTFQVAVMLGNGSDIYSVPMQLQFNPAVLQLVNVDAGDFLSRDGQAVALVHRDDGSGTGYDHDLTAAGSSGDERNRQCVHAYVQGRSGGRF